MTPSSPLDDMRGILYSGSPEGRFDLRRLRPSDPVLAEVVEWFWSVSWALPAGAHHDQHLLNHPCFQLVVERGESGIFPIVTGRASKRLSGEGRAFGARFWPGAFHAIWKRDVSELLGPRVPLESAFGPAGAHYEQEVLAANNDAQRAQLAERFLRSLKPELDEGAQLTRQIVELITGDRAAGTVAHVARAHGLSVRTLQRLFRRYVGMTPKWVVQRARLHDAIEALEAGQHVDLAELAVGLEYYDQAHFTRDFTSIVGRSPTRYVSELRDRREHPQD